MTLDEKLATSFVETLNDTKLSRAELAQKLVDMQTDMMKRADEAGTKAWTDLQEQWRDQAMKLPEFGGDNLAKTAEGIGQLITKFGGNAEEVAALKGAFDLTGAGNHPAVFAFLGRVARELVKEGTPASGSSPSSKEGATHAQRLFPNLPSTG